MKHTLSMIRAAVLQWSGDPAGNLTAPAGNYARLDALINEAYQEIVHLIDESPEPWNQSPESEAINITLVSGTTVYEIEADVRQVVEVRPIDSEGATPGDALDIVPYPRRFGGVGDVYLFRSQINGRWYLGLIDEAPTWPTLRVYTKPDLARLTAGQDVPYAIPFQHHEILIYKTTVNLNIQDDKEAGPAAVMFTQARANLVNSLNQSVARHAARRLG